MQSAELSKSSTEELANLTNSLSSSVENNSNLNSKKDELSMRPPPNLNSQLSARTDDESINLNIIPDTSYSSSDDEDFFFDAEEEAEQAAHQLSLGGSQKSNSTLRLEQKLSKAKIGTAFNSNALNELKLQQSNLEEKDYDACYEDDNEDELGSLEGHGSVISHLISQVKIGMDLTSECPGSTGGTCLLFIFGHFCFDFKNFVFIPFSRSPAAPLAEVVLPTFILERRSLLEMYADFFAHPDLFCSIPDFETPEQRFIQTVKWYLSAFHAGRKSSVAKKPYNPILGETFKCFWNIPNYKKKVGLFDHFSSHF